MDFETCEVEIPFDRDLECQFLVGMDPIILFIAKKHELMLLSTKMRKYFETSNQLYSPSNGAAHGCTDKNCSVIHLPDFDPEKFHFFLKLIYNESHLYEIKLMNDNNIYVLMHIAMRFSVTHIMHACLKYVSNETLIKLFGENYAMGNTYVTRIVINAIRKRDGLDFDFKCLSTLTLSAFFELIKVCAGLVNEDERLRMIKQYAIKKHLIASCEQDDQQILLTRVYFKGGFIRTTFYLSRILKLLNMKLIKDVFEYDMLNDVSKFQLGDIAEEVDA